MATGHVLALPDSYQSVSSASGPPCLRKISPPAEQETKNGGPLGGDRSIIRRCRTAVALTLIHASHGASDVVDPSVTEDRSLWRRLQMAFIVHLYFSALLEIPTLNAFEATFHFGSIWRTQGAVRFAKLSFSGGQQFDNC
ncbi:hypothetical protein MRX96_007065 [Rhipicephalus microplus]